MLVSRVAVMLTAATWLRTRRSRFFFFLLCSPLLLPLLCASVPLVCAAEIFFRLRIRRTRFRKSSSAAVAVAVAADEDEARLRRCEEGCGCGGSGGADEEEEEGGLLQRYLEDQLLLVRSVYDCGDDDGDSVGRDRDPDPDPDRSRVPFLS